VGLFGGKPETSAAAPAAAPEKRREVFMSPASPSSSSEAPTIIGKDALIKGEISSSSDMLIEGRVEGQVHGAKRVIIGETGDVAAHIKAQTVTIRGTVRGDCEGSTKVEITSTGKVFGNIASRAIVVAEGATFRGASKMAEPEPPKPAEPPRPEKAVPATSSPPAPTSAH
jgi:cytoskeletal protein CcmA (bactofilin family)